MTFIEANELIVLIFGLLGFIPVIREYIHNKRFSLMLVSYTVLFLGLLATVLEALFWGPFLNGVEHFVGIFVAGICFMLVAKKNNQGLKSITEQTEKKLAIVKKKKRGAKQ